MSTSSLSRLRTSVASNRRLAASTAGVWTRLPEAICCCVFDSTDCWPSKAASAAWWIPAVEMRMRSALRCGQQGLEHGVGDTDQLRRSLVGLLVLQQVRGFLI